MPTVLILALVFVVVALVDNVATAVVVATALWGVLEGWGRRPRRAPRPQPAAEDRPGWGYEFPWADLPGMAYVGITGRGPEPDGWLPRWDDVDDDGRRHHIHRPDVRADLVVVYEFTTLADADAWETARIAELAAAGHTLLNIDKNPGRPCWERLGYGAEAA